jgi:hypothetical protein
VALSSASGGLHARLTAGRIAIVIDASAGGALIETTVRLAPGARLTLQLPAAGQPVAAPGIVVRASVCEVSAERGIRYRGAVQFDVPVAFNFTPTACVG